MKVQTMRIKLELEVAYPDHIDDEWIREQYLGSDRLSTLRFKGEIGEIICASGGVNTVRVAPGLMNKPLSSIASVEQAHPPAPPKPPEPPPAIPSAGRLRQALNSARAWLAEVAG